MPLDATIGGVTANSYVTEAEATAYFADSLQGDSWTSLSSKEAALVSATRYLDMLGWKGSRATTEQALELPRNYLCDINGTLIESDVIPPKIKQAVYELALYMALNLDAFIEEDLTTRIKVSVIELENELKEFGAFSSLPLRVQNLINPYIESYSGSGFTLSLQ